MLECRNNGYNWLDRLASPDDAHLAADIIVIGGGEISSIIKADPAKVGALRLDPRSADAAYIAQLKAAFAADASDAEWQAICNFLTLDDPASIFGTPLKTTRDPSGEFRVPIFVVPSIAQFEFISKTSTLR